MRFKPFGALRGEVVQLRVGVPTVRDTFARMLLPSCLSAITGVDYIMPLGTPGDFTGAGILLESLAFLKTFLFYEQTDFSCENTIFTTSTTFRNVF